MVGVLGQQAFKLADHDGVEGALFLVEDDLRTYVFYYVQCQSL